MEVNCVIDIEQGVIPCYRREGADFLSDQDIPHVPNFTHSPFDDSLNFVSFNFKS